MPFKIVQTIGQGRATLSTVPDTWESNGVLYWPRKKADKLRKNDESVPQETWFQMACILKRHNIKTYDAAEYVIMEMGNKFGIDVEEPIVKEKRDVKTQTCGFAENCLLEIQNDPLMESMFENSTEEPERKVFVEELQKDFSIDIEYNKTIKEKDKTSLSYTEGSSDINSKIDLFMELLKSMYENQTLIFEQLESISYKLTDMQTTNSELTTVVRRKESNELKTVMEPIDNLQSLIDFENCVSQPELCGPMMEKFSFVCGKGKGRGVNNAYTLIDIIFTRKFMTLCSWAGGSRQEESKICFKQFKGTINFFCNLVHISDDSFTMEDCEEFLKRILRNSSKRNESKFMRKSSVKHRAKKVTQFNTEEQGSIEEATKELGEGDTRNE